MRSSFGIRIGSESVLPERKCLTDVVTQPVKQADQECQQKQDHDGTNNGCNKIANSVDKLKTFFPAGSCLFRVFFTGVGIIMNNSVLSDNIIGKCST